MIHAITTTHAIPQPSRCTSARVQIGIAICEYCLSELGTFRTAAERIVLETRHTCRDKVLSHIPAVSAPYN
jgi:hypothetical protein